MGIRDFSRRILTGIGAVIIAPFLALGAVASVALILVGAVVGGILGMIPGALVMAILPGVSLLEKALTWVCVLGGAILGAQLVYLMIRDSLTSYARFPTTHGSARFAPLDQQKKLLTPPEGWLIGRLSDRKRSLLRFNDVRHMLTLAPARAGKGRGVILPNLLSVARPMLVIDPRGENTAATAHIRENYGNVYVLDPFGVTGQLSAAYNPLSRINANNPDIGDDALALAHSLINPENGSLSPCEADARLLLTAYILVAVCHEPPEKSTLMSVRDYVSRTPADMRRLLEWMGTCTTAHGQIARLANSWLSQDPRAASAALSVCQRVTQFLDSPRIAATLGRSDFQFEELHHTTTTIFLILPPDRLDSYGSWLRLMLDEAICALSRSPRRQTTPLLMIDDFGTLGRLPSLTRTAGALAGCGMQLWLLCQNLPQLRALYGADADSLLAGAGMIQAFNVQDQETAEWLSGMMGQTTIVSHSAGYSRERFGMGRTQSYQTQHAGRALMTPDEILRLGDDQQIVLLTGWNPILCGKLHAPLDKEFRPLLEAPRRPLKPLPASLAGPSVPLLNYQPIIRVESEQHSE